MLRIEGHPFFVVCRAPFRSVFLSVMQETFWAYVLMLQTGKNIPHTRKTDYRSVKRGRETSEGAGQENKRKIPLNSAGP